LTIVDKTELLSGDNFTRELEGPAEQVDTIFLFFDPENFFIFREFCRSIEARNSHEDKIRIIFNKAETMDREELSNAYGQIMYSLSQVLNQQEPPEIHFGSLSDDKKRLDEHKLREDLLSLYNNIRIRTDDNLHIYCGHVW